MTPRSRLALANHRLITGALQFFQGATGLPVAFGGPVRTGDRALVIDQLRGTRTRSLQQLQVDTGAGLGGKAVALARPSTVTDYLNARGITHKYDRAVEPEGLRAMLAVPIRVGSVTRAVLYAATREEASLGDRTLRAAATVAGRLERDIEVEEEIHRRLADPPQISTPETGDLRAELLEIANRTSDHDARGRLLALCERWDPLESAPDAALTPREVDVLRCVGEGCSNHETADRLGLLPNTVKSYLKHAMRKLDATNRVQAVNRARRTGLL